MLKDYLRTEIGILEIGIEHDKLVSLKFVEDLIEPTENGNNHFFDKVKAELSEYFGGKRQNFEIEIDPQGTDFQKKVWNNLLNIPYGKTKSYAEVAKELGDIKSIRAAASANGKNPIAIIIPCHRVIGKNGELTGYAGGLPRKKFLLDLENKIKNGVNTLF